MFPTTHENNARVTCWRLAQMSCVMFCVGIAGTIVPPMIERVVLVWASIQNEEAWAGHAFVLTIQLMMVLPVFWVAKLFFSFGKCIDGQRYGVPDKNGAPDGCLNVSHGEYQDGSDTL